MVRCVWQVVAAVQGKLLSIYDGITQYKLGQTLHAKRGGAAWAPLDACYFAFPSMQQVGFTAQGLENNTHTEKKLPCHAVIGSIIAAIRTCHSCIGESHVLQFRI